MMKERPILFSAPMVRALLDGRKTQTRRVLREQPFQHEGGNSLEWWIPLSGRRVSWRSNARITKTFDKNVLIASSTEYISVSEWLQSQCPYGKSGDRLWVRETFTQDGVNEDAAREMGRAPVHCRADGEAPDYLNVKWRPSIFMPRWASRITLEITDVRVQRLQDISEDDARAEGVKQDCPVGYIPAYQDGPFSYCFAQLWDSINGEGAWDVNPWVWGSPSSGCGDAL